MLGNSLAFQVILFKDYIDISPRIHFQLAQRCQNHGINKRVHWIGFLPFSSSLAVEAPESLSNLQTTGLSSKQRQTILLKTTGLSSEQRQTILLKTTGLSSKQTQTILLKQKDFLLNRHKQFSLKQRDFLLNRDKQFSLKQRDFLLNRDKQQQYSK